MAIDTDFFLDDEEPFDYDQSAEQLDDDDDGCFRVEGTVERLPVHIEKRLLEVSDDMEPLLSANRSLEDELTTLDETIKQATSDYTKAVSEHGSAYFAKMLDENLEAYDDSPVGDVSDSQLEESRLETSGLYERLEQLEEEQQHLREARKKILLSLTAKVLVAGGAESLVRELTSLIGVNEPLKCSNDTDPALVYPRPQPAVIYNQLAKQFNL